MKSESFAYVLKRSAVMALVLLIFAGGTGMASASYDFPPAVTSDTVDYYRGYGEPLLGASLKGDAEFRKGDNPTLQITLSNSGTIEKIVVNKSVGDISNQLNYQLATLGGSGEKAVVVSAEQLADYQAEMSDLNALVNLSMKEMAYEAARINASGISATLVSSTKLIEVPSGSEIMHIDTLPAGGTKTLSFPININKNIASGRYHLDLAVGYQFQDNVVMYKRANSTELLTTFLTDSDCVREYADRHIILPIEIMIEESPVFEVTHVDGTLVSGQTKTVQVTYTNTGDAVAYDAEAKISLMNPLTASSNKAYLGDVAPGESVTASYVIAASGDAIEKIYGVSSDIRYYDDKDDLRLSSAMKVDMTLKAGKSYLTPKNVLTLLAAGCILYGLYAAVRRFKAERKSKKSE